MRALPDGLLRTLALFAVACTRPTLVHLHVLVRGALLATGRRTVAAALRAVGLDHERHFTTYHRVLNRAVWSPLPLRPHPPRAADCGLTSS
jgi:hypothetical protein